MYTAFVFMNQTPVGSLQDYMLMLHHSSQMFVLIINLHMSISKISMNEKLPCTETGITYIIY